MTGDPEKHRRQKWGWTLFGLAGLIDYAIRGDISQLWVKPLAESVPMLFLLSVGALALSEWAAEEAADSGEDDNTPDQEDRWTKRS